jgi:hypothetical protein
MRVLGARWTLKKASKLTKLRTSTVWQAEEPSCLRSLREPGQWAGRHQPRECYPRSFTERAGRSPRSGVTGSGRKVRTPQGSVLANDQRG